MNLIILYIAALIMPLLLSLILTPRIYPLAFKVGAIDRPDKRKVHKKTTPRLGGVAIAISFAVSAGFLTWLADDLFAGFPDLFFQSVEGSLIFFIILAPAFLILLLGIFDDILGLSPGFKFSIQILLAALACLAGFKITVLGNPFGDGVVELGMAAYPISILWIVGVTNAFNLIDGLDGLASGTAVIALSAIGIIAWHHGQPDILFICFMLGGATLGFLWYNFRPAKIFLGDSGSLFLGFLLALLSIQSYTKISTSFAVFIPIFILGLPILDTLLSMARRLLSQLLPEVYNGREKISIKQFLRAVVQPDKSHVHHQLVDQGISHKNTVLLLYTVSGLFGAGAVVLALTNRYETNLLVFILMGLLLLLGIQKLRYKEISLLHNGIFLRLYDKWILHKNYLPRVLDLSFVVISLFITTLIMQGSLYSDSPASAQAGPDVVSFLIVALLQWGILLYMGIYRESIRQIGIADVYRIIKAIASAVAGAALFVLLIPISLPGSLLLFLILNFYILLTLVLGVRILFLLLQHLFRRSRNNNQMVLIYGADEKGVLLLHKLLADEVPARVPLGFLDEDPLLEGTYINGYQVFGGHWKLEQLIRKKGVKQLFISNPIQNPRIRDRILKMSREYGLDIKKFKPVLEDYSDLDSGTSNPFKESIPHA